MPKGGWPGGTVVGYSYDRTLNVTTTKLDNGLTILTKEVHASPVAYFAVYYNVGARNEVIGQTGLSHILEHMMFKGTRDLPPGAIDRLFSRYGFDYNASTDIDVTEYHELIPADKLELAVHVEADRMANSAFDPTELAHEMVVVRSELEGDSADPVGQLGEFVFLPLAFQAHPYRTSTLGWRADVENAAKHRDVIYKYYKDHYMPNDATVVVVGDVETAKVVAQCRKYFGSISAGKVESHYITPEPPQTGERRAVLRRPGTVGHVTLGWRAAPLGSPDHYTQDVISAILSSGDSSRLHQALVETKIAQSVSTLSVNSHDPYVFEVDADAYAGVPIANVEAALEAEINKLSSGTVSQEELDRAKSQIETQFTYQSDGVSDQAAQLGFYQAVNGDYRYLETYLSRIRAVTAEDIRKDTRQYFTPDKRIVATFDPLPLSGRDSLPSEPPSRSHSASPTSATAAGTRDADAVDAKFDSHVSAHTVERQLPVRCVLPNGLVVLVQENHANKTVSIAGIVRAGSVFDPPGKYGLAALTANLLPRGAHGESALQIAKRLESAGATIEYEPKIENTKVIARSLSKDFALTLSTCASELRAPDFPAADIETLRGQALSALEDARQDGGGTDGPGKLAEIAMSQLLYPSGHPYWQPSLDDQAMALKAIKRDDIVAYYSRFYRPDAVTIAVVGDVTVDQAVREVNKQFGDWARPAEPVTPVVIPVLSMQLWKSMSMNGPLIPNKSVMLPIPGSTQTSVYIGDRSQVKRTDADYYAMRVLNAVLGGSVFSSRLGKSIRDQHGLAYTVESRFKSTHGAGPFTIFVGTNPENAAEAVRLADEITAALAAKGATAREVKQAEDLLAGSFSLSLETNEDIVRNILDEEDYDLGLNYVNRLPSLYRSVTVAQVNAVAKKLLRPDRFALVEAGAMPTK